MRRITPAHLDDLKEDYERQGFAIARGLFRPSEVDELNEHFRQIHERKVPGLYEPLSLEDAEGDMLKAYPRVMNSHRFDALARRWLVEPRVAEVLEGLIEEEPIAAQSMYYFKPPGSRGQTLHQDNFFLQVMPGTCIAAWTALDEVDRLNGGLIVVPFTHEGPIDCSKLDRKPSYEGGTSIPVPEGKKGVPAEMSAGDTLFFNGELIHGSGPNRTRDRWRRTFIGHYCGASCESISQFYHPLVRMDGTDTERDVTRNGGPCGAGTFEGAAH